MTDRRRAARIVADWRRRRETGAEESAADLLRAHPGLAAELRRHLDVQQRLERVASEEATANAAPPTPLRTRIGDFRILREIGRGGMGVVYEAEQISMGRTVALKVLFPGVTLNPRAVERFRREAQAAGRLHHTNIVAVYGMGEEDGVWFYAMERVLGRTLAAVTADLKRLGGRPPAAPSPSDPSAWLSTGGTGRAFFARAASAFAGLAEALDHAHASGIVHRDVKPSNVILDPEGTLKLTDFGLAHVEEAGDALTMTGDVIGTPAYMSPEQIRPGARPLDARTDIYSLGATLYEFLALRPPFVGATPHDVHAQILTTDPLPPRRWNPRIPRDLDTIVAKAMERDPARRYRSAGDFARDLRLFAEGATIRARRTSPLGRAWRVIKRQSVRAGLIAALVCALGAVWVLAVLESRAEGDRSAADARRREVEYLSLCASAEDAFYRRSEHAQGPSSYDLFGRAIGLLPERYEAYLGRMLCEGSRSGSLADVEAAAARGAPKRAVHLARAWLLRGMGHESDAAAEEKAADGYSADDLRARLLEAWMTANRGEFDRCLPALDSIIEEAPHGSAVRYLARRARCALRLTRGDAPGAMVDIHALQEEGDRSPELVVGMAGVWRRLGHSDTADGLLAGLFEQHRTVGTLDAWTRLCDLYNDGKEWSWLGKAAEAGVAAYPDSALLVAHQGWSEMKANRLVDALALARRAVQLDPGCHGAQALLGHVYDHSGDRERGAEALQRAAALGPRCAGCPAGLADVLRALRRYPDALAAADEAIRRCPRDPVGHLARARVSLDMGKPKDALRAADRALALDPKEFRALEVRGAALSGLGQTEKALEAFERLSLIAPNSGAAHRLRGVTLHQAGRLVDALAELDTSIKLDPGDADAHGKRGSLLSAMGRVQDAADALMRAESLDPMEAEYPINLGFEYLKLNRADEALKAEDRAVALDPEDALAHGHRASALLLLDRFADAKEAAERAIALDPSLKAPRWRRGMALMRLGQQADGMRALDDAATRDTRGNELNRLLAWLRAAGKEAETRAVLFVAIDHGLGKGMVGNVLAWWLVERAGGDAASVSHALALAEAALVTSQEDGALWNTLGVARFRAGDDRGTVEALERSVKLTNGGAWDFLFLAMANQRMSEHEAALEWYRRGLESGKGAFDKDLSLAMAKAETEALLGIAPTERAADK